MASPRQVRPPKRRPVACLHCREKKVKCDGSQPCSYCAAREIGCVFPRKANRRRDKRRLHPAPDGPNDELRSVARSPGHNFRVQTSFRNSENLGEHHDHALSHPPPTHCSPPPLHGRRNWSAVSPGRNNGNSVLFDLTGVVSPPDTSNSTAEYSELASTLDLDPVMRHIPELGGSLSGGSGNSFEGSIIEPNTGSEYHGASSILAICSAAAIEWVVQQTHNQRYPRLSESMAATIASQLKLNKRFDKKRAPEPSFEAAWRYYEAYFQQAESVFPVINRPSFESSLRQTFNQGEKPDDDPAWYALRHIIYAAGKRQLLNNDPQEHTFSHIQEQCWPYFENAMSVYTELLFSEVSIMGVQALIAMAMFVEGLGSPCLEYMLCTGASRLAQSQGLHRQPPRDWKLSPSQVSQRNLLFWTIYSYDKHISLRAGRPSAIDDDDITCAPPRFSDQNGIEGAWVSKVVEHARLSSEITKWLAIFRSKNIPLDDSIHKLRKLNDRLTSWRESLPTPFRPGSDLKRAATTTSKLHINQIIYIHCALHGSIVVLNSPFALPWLAETIAVGNDALYESQVQKSTPLVVEAARAIIKLTHFIEIDCSTPVWLSFYYPFIAVVNIFIYILRFPTRPTVQMDLSLLDVVTGYFGRMELATAASVSFPFVRELSQCAQEAVTRTRTSKTPSNSQATTSTAVTNSKPQNEFRGTSLQPQSSLREARFEFDLTSPRDDAQGLGIAFQADSQIADQSGVMEFDIEDPLLGLLETDLSWGLLSVIPRPEHMSATGDVQ